MNSNTPSRGNLSICCLGWLALWLTLPCLRGQSAEAAPGDSAGPPLPDFGLILNDDGDFTATDPDPAVSGSNLRRMIASLEHTPVKTLAYSVGAGSDILYYPTRVASTWGWQPTPKYGGEAWAKRAECAKAVILAGVDLVRIAAEQAKRQGLFFVPSYRMNDSHFVRDPINYPLTGRFWLENQDKTLGASPVAGYDYSNLLDYSHAAVRDYRLRIINEVIARYSDVMDGLELDFNRVQIFFPPGKAEAGAPLMTAVLEKVRARLDLATQASGRRYALFVRVPPALRNCAWSGLAVSEWISRRLVDVIIPSQLMTVAHCLPIEEFVALARPAGCRAYAAIYPRTHYTRPFVAAHSTCTYGNVPARHASVELIRGAVSNAFHAGADGCQLYNFNLPPTPEHVLMMQAMAHPDLLRDVSRIYAVTPAYFNDREDTYQYRKQIPATLEPDWAATFRLRVGHPPATAGENKPTYCGLRIGFASDPDPNLRIIVVLNQTTLKAGRLGWRLRSVAGLRRGGGVHLPATAAYFQAEIPDLAALRPGTNTVSVTVKSGPKHPAQLTVTEMQLGILYAEK